MFEIEVSHGRLDKRDIPEEVIQHFIGTCLSADAVTILPWEEHCTECAMPMCYETCDLYEPRRGRKM